MARPHLHGTSRTRRARPPGRWDRPRLRRDPRRPAVPTPMPHLLRLVLLLALISLTWRIPR